MSAFDALAIADHDVVDDATEGLKRALERNLDGEDWKDAWTFFRTSLREDPNCRRGHAHAHNPDKARIMKKKKEEGDAVQLLAALTANGGSIQLEEHEHYVDGGGACHIVRNARHIIHYEKLGEPYVRGMGRTRVHGRGYVLERASLLNGNTRLVSREVLHVPGCSTPSTRRPRLADTQVRLVHVCPD
eukprot:TRINITY_DN7034_c1_g1_i1.p2 TRINITY_DN7034_c1_g1~~TRINITY_DN7034_c1_g1_i1.p2  ORF type:complete len:188 (+),score=29.54 TRINITY_DN7034_c1_g1_i1:469-1032(+)